uniref:MIF4G domain-containing protein n=1 Tax=Caenorhabditis tropicalis TaxID=1561998 RepID=A0A1I7SZ92_9PELO
MLRLSAYVEVDSKNRITKYNDGELILQGDHSQSAKSKIGWAARRVRDKRKMEEDGLTEGIKRETPDALEIVIKELLEPKNEIKEEEDLSTSEVFNAFLKLLLSFNLESLDQLQTKIEKCIEEAAGEKTPSKTIRIALECCLLLVTKRTKQSSEEISLDVFLQLFRRFVISLKLPHSLQQDIEQSIESIEDKKIPVETVKTALETSLLLLAP